MPVTNSTPTAVTVISNGDSIRCSHCRVIADAEHVYVDPDCPIHAPHTTAVTVSDRMRALVKKYAETIYAFMDEGRTPEMYEERKTAREDLEREIATLEAINTIALQHYDDTIKDSETVGLGMLDNRFVDAIAPLLADPAEENLEGNPPTFQCAQCRKMVPMGAHTCLPQTLSEADLNNDSGYFKKPADSVIAALPVWLVDEIKAARAVAREDPDDNWDAGLLYLANDRSRLITELEGYRTWERMTCPLGVDFPDHIANLRMRAEVADAKLAKLQSAAVLQKEELEQYRRAWLRAEGL